MKKIFFSLLALSSFANFAKAQDLNFSQFYETPLLRNPALAGIFKGDIRVKGSFRSQWASITVPYTTTAVSAEYKIPFNNNIGDWMTLGVQVTSDAAGSIRLKKTAISPVLSFNKSLSEINDSYLSVAFTGGPVQTQFDQTKVFLPDGQNGINGANVTPSYTYWDMGAGLTYSSNFGDDMRYYVGAAMYHINDPKVNYFSDNTESSILGRKLVINGGLTLQTSDVNKVFAYMDYIKQGQSEQFMAGMLYGVELANRYSDNKTINLNFGTLFRWNDALIPVVNMDYYDVSVGLSYDINISRLHIASQYAGGFELTATYRGFLNKRTAAGNAVRCPGF
jgi:type IX secretion system PorP/SprF family membrane protein